MRQQHNATLDGLRGVAAGAVVWYHITQHFRMSTPYRGYLAVDFFFVLSGIVLANAYQARLLGGMSFFSFIKLRLIRLYPMVVLGLVFGLVSRFAVLFTTQGVHHVHASISLLMAFIFGLFLLPCPSAYGLQPNEIFPLDFPLWSLMFEILINIVYGIVARNPVLLRGVTFVAVLFGALTLFPCALAQGGLSGGHSFPTLITGFARVSFSFFAGVGLSHILTKERLVVLPSVPFPLLAGLLLLTLFAGSRFGPLYDVGVVLICFPALVALGAKDCIGPNWRRFALWAGAVSYPLYVLHTVTIHLGHVRSHSSIALTAEFTLAFLSNVAISYAALRWFDEPVRTWLRRSFRPRFALVSLPKQAETIGSD